MCQNSEAVVRGAGSLQVGSVNIQHISNNSFNLTKIYYTWCGWVKRSSHEQCDIISHNVLIFLYGQVEDRVFWSDAKLDRLESANLDGSDRVEVLKVKTLYLETILWK